MAPIKARPSAHAIEIAPTGRASCRRCRSRIAAGALRLRTTASIKPGRSTAFFRHATPACITPALAAAVSTAHGGANRVPARGNLDARDADAVRAIIAVAAHRFDSSARQVGGAEIG